MLDANRARALAVMSGERLGAFPNIPTLKEAMGIDYATGAWRGIAGPLNSRPKRVPPRTPPSAKSSARPNTPSS